MRKECISCKVGKQLCGEPCPYLDRIPSPDVEVGEELFGPSPPAVFVGRKGYPEVNVGPMLPAQDPGVDVEVLDSTEAWFGRDMDELIGMRGSLVRGMTAAKVTSRDALVEVGREVAMASEPVDTEVHFEKAPEPGFTVDGSTQPMGPSGVVDRAELAENPTVPRKVEYLVGDTDARAGTAMRELRGEVPVDHQIRLLSAGLLGREKHRKLVPTRWSITAVDSNLSEDMADRVKDFKELEAPMLGTAEYLDNRFALLLLPGVWSYEFVEIFGKGAIWAPEPTIIRDHEHYDGRTSYADTTAGAYYAARLAATELLVSMRRQATVVVVREIGPEYIVPLGVWLIRETVREAARDASRVESEDDGLRRVTGYLRSGEVWQRDSPVMTRRRQQTALDDFV